MQTIIAKMKKLLTTLSLTVLLSTALSAQSLIHQSIKEVTDVMVHDIFSPPVASRIYAYVTIAGYEAARPADPTFPSFAGILHQLSKPPEPEAAKKYDFSIAAVEAILTVGRALVISEETIENYK